VELPEFSANKYGWPSVIRSQILLDTPHPVDWSSVVSVNQDRLGSPTISAVPQLADLAAFIRMDDELAKRLTLPGIETSDLRERWLDHDTLELVGDIVGRSVGLGADTDAELLAIYLERERAIFNAKLSVDVVVPILLTQFDTEHFAISKDVRIERMDEATNASRAPHLHSTVNPFLQAAATHAVVLSGLEIANPGPGPRSATRGSQIDSRIADVAFQAIEIASSTPVGYAQILLRPIGWSDGWTHDLPPIETVNTVRRYPPAFDEQGWNTAGRSIALSGLTTLPKIFENLSRALPRVELAARRLFQSDLRVDEDDILIDACIGIEALLGEGRDELTHRMSLRAAAALSTGSASADPRAIYDLTKKVYAERSTVVHGGIRKKQTIRLGDQEFSTPRSAWVLLRYLLLSALEADEPWTPAGLDGRLFDSLAHDDATSSGKATQDR